MAPQIVVKSHSSSMQAEARGESPGWGGTGDNVCRQTLTGLYHNELSVLEKLKEVGRQIVLHREHTFLQVRAQGYVCVCVCSCVNVCRRTLGVFTL